MPGQAALCRVLARQISNRADARELVDKVNRYDAEARTLETERDQPSDAAAN
ncbi:MAG: hypothetical protein P8Y71_09540 [Pseudolabrys sp.]